MSEHLTPPPAAEQPPAAEPDTKDWTPVVENGCPECGFEPFDPTTTADRLLATVPRWQAALARPDVARRPAPQVWSPLEYGCHVVDTQRIFRDRLDLMLREDDPLFANWDQDATAVAERYWEQIPSFVAEQYELETGRAVAVWHQVGENDWERPSRRSNGSRFTVRTFALYLVHDIEHHLHDVGA